MLKKFVSVITGAFMILIGLCGCTNSKQQDNDITNDIEVNKLNWIMDYGQDGAIFNDYAFRFTETGKCCVYSLSQNNLVSSFYLDETDKIIPHANSVCFSSEYYDENDEFPLIYINLYNNYKDEEDNHEGECCVYRIYKINDEFSSELVQIIKISFVKDTTLWECVNSNISPWGNFIVDKNNKFLYAYVMRDDTFETQFYKFCLPSITDGEWCETYGCNVCELKINDVKGSFKCTYFNYIQGVTYYNNYIFSIEGLGDGYSPNQKLRVINLDTGIEKYNISLYQLNLGSEPEMIEMYKGLLYYSTLSGDIYTIDLSYFACIFY